MKKISLFLSSLLYMSSLYAQSNIEKEVITQFQQDFNAQNYAAIFEKFSPEAKKARSSPALGTAYIVRQFKREEEITLLRQVYGRKFIQVSVYLDKEERKKQQRKQKERQRKKQEKKKWKKR